MNAVRSQHELQSFRAEMSCLYGTQILIVEDSYYLAEDMADVLRCSGGRILGPVATHQAALRLLIGHTPSCALLDIELFGVIQFNVAHVLRDKQIPFAFVTAHDPRRIPQDLADVAVLRKPVRPYAAVGAVVALLGKEPSRGSMPS